jgi:hypothetical protein
VAERRRRADPGRLRVAGAGPDRRAHGRAWHTTRAAFHRDRRRDRRYLVAGWRVVRVDGEALGSGRSELVEELRALLSPAPARSA